MAERLRLPVLPMRETVVFPGVAVPITAGRPGTLEAVEKVLEGDRRLFAVCQRENADDVAPANLYEMGVIVRVLQVQRAAGGLQLLIQGEKRAKALSYERTGETIALTPPRASTQYIAHGDTLTVGPSAPGMGELLARGDSVARNVQALTAEFERQLVTEGGLRDLRTAMASTNALIARLGDIAAEQSRQITLTQTTLRRSVAALTTSHR